MSETDPARIDPAQLDLFLHHYLNTLLPGGSVSTILTTSFNALVDAGVVVLPDGESPVDHHIYVHGGRVMMGSVHSTTTTTWVPQGGLPSFDGAIEALAELLVAILNSTPWKGPIDHPHTRN